MVTDNAVSKALGIESIADLRGLGPKSEEMLARAGITSVDQLRRLGAVAAYAPVYGLALLRHLQQFPTMAITEGTLDPLLDRLKREELVSAEWLQDGDTRPRKYYRLTGKGEQKLKALAASWRQSVTDINALLAQPPGGPTDTQGS